MLYRLSVSHLEIESIIRKNYISPVFVSVLSMLKPRLVRTHIFRWRDTRIMHAYIQVFELAMVDVTRSVVSELVGGEPGMSLVLALVGCRTVENQIGARFDRSNPRHYHAPSYVISLRNVNLNYSNHKVSYFKWFTEQVFKIIIWSSLQLYIEILEMEKKPTCSGAL